MSILKKFAVAAGLTAVMGAYGFTQNQDARAQAEDEARVSGTGITAVPCRAVETDDMNHDTLECAPSIY